MAKITIFGLAGTGKSTVGKMLAKELRVCSKTSQMRGASEACDQGVVTYSAGANEQSNKADEGFGICSSYTFVSSGNLFRNKAASLGLSLYAFEELCNTDKKYDIELDKEIEKFGKENDNFVLESRLGWHFIPDSFKIKLTCDLKTRVERVARRDKVTFEEALAKTKFRESSGVKRYAETYGITNFAPDSVFDCIVDSTKIGPDGIVKKMLEAFNGRLNMESRI